MLSVAADPNIHSIRVNHNRVRLALAAIWMRLKSRSGRFPQNAHILLEPDWLRALKLLSKLCVLRCKLGFSRFRQRQLLRENLKLRVQCGELGFGKGDALIFDSSGSDVTDDAFDRVEHKRSNAPGEPRRTTDT